MVNKITLMGHVGQDPIITKVGDISCATFNLATGEKYKGRDGQQKEVTDWHRIVAWRGKAELIEKYVKKGTCLYIEGKLKHRSYVKDNVTHYISEVVVNEMRFLSKGNSTSPAQAAAAIPTPGVNDIPVEVEDDLPF